MAKKNPRIFENLRKNNDLSERNTNYTDDLQEHNSEIDTFKLLEMRKFSSQKSDKIYLFQRNKALFSNVALQFFWESRSKFDLPNYVYKVIHYYFKYVYLNLHFIYLRELFSVAEDTTTTNCKCLTRYSLIRLNPFS